MRLIDKIQSLFCGKISDEEVATQEWVLCPNCDVNISKQDLFDNSNKCPNCGYNMSQDV